jgi:hypothetical protein
MPYFTDGAKKPRLKATNRSSEGLACSKLLNNLGTDRVNNVSVLLNRLEPKNPIKVF